MAYYTIEVTGIDEGLLRRLDDQVRAGQAEGRSEYIRELIRKDVIERPASEAVPRTFRDLLGPVAEETRRLGESEEEIEEFLRGEIEAHRRERRVSHDRAAGRVAIVG